MYWWMKFLPQWNSSSSILQTEWTASPAMDLYTDASGRYGWGAYWSGKWIQAQWSAKHMNNNITWKELYAISHGKSSMQLLQQSTHGAISGNGRKCYTIVTINQYV